MTEKSYILSLSEFYLLVGKTGNSYVFGFSDSDSTSCSELSLVHRINKMVRAGLINVDDSGLVPNSDLWDIICSVANAKKCIVLNFADPFKDVLCCYIGESIVVTSIDSNSEGKNIRLRKMDRQHFFAFCKELLKSDCVYNDFIDEFEESGVVEYLRKNGFRSKAAELTVLDEMIWVVDEYHTENGKKKRRICLADNIPRAQIFEITDESFMVSNSGEDETERLLESFYD